MLRGIKLGIIARSDNTGLGNQTHELVKMLNPHKVMLIDSSHFNNNTQHPERYSEYNVIQTAAGFPDQHEIDSFLHGLDVVLSCETFYRSNFVRYAKQNHVKTILQYNYEFLDYLKDSTSPLPDVLLAPSPWNIDIVKDRFAKKSKVINMPPPTDSTLFNNAKEFNLSQDHNRVLHIAGKQAVHDRNGTNIVVEMLKNSKADYELVIKTQSDLDIKYKDSRLTIDNSNPENHEEMYSGFDAMVLPRRYAGLCLPMNEALLSALPVFMSNVSPNNEILPKKWLTNAARSGEFMTRTMIDIYDTDAKVLAENIDDYMKSKNKAIQKQEAYDLGFTKFSSENLKKSYLDLFHLLTY